MTTSIMPGTIIGGRYQLADLLDEVGGARSWRAVDQVLERNVMAFVVPAGDPRVEPLLEAARRSATVTDPHLLRVLDADVDTEAGLAWVINEWGAGQSLDVMIAHEALTADRAAWLVREVAAAIAVAHRHGLAHGRLAPENVMVTESGTVRLIGFAIDASIQHTLLRSGHYPECDPQEADLVDLAGLLYAGLVGRWPGASGSHVQPAPRDARGPLRPRQVRAGVPKPLDAICGRILGRSHPDRTAHQLSAVLTEYIGELTAADPSVLPAALPELDASLDDLAAVTGHTDPEAKVLSTSGSGPLVPAEPDDTTPPLVEEAWADVTWSEDESTTTGAGTDPAETEATQAVPQPVTVGDETQRAAPVPDDPAEHDPDWHRPRTETGPPPPPLTPLPERPLFAPEGTRRTPRGEVRPSATSGWGTEVAAARLSEDGEPPSDENDGWDDGWDDGEDDGWDVLPAQRRPNWPLGTDDANGVPDDWEERTRRPWLRLPLVVAVLAVIAVLVVGALTLSGKTDLGTGSSDRTGATSAPSQAPSGQRLKIAGVNDLDPFGVPPEENPDEVSNSVDNDPATAWQTVTYRRRPDLGGLKPGVGMVVDLGSIQRIGAVDLRLVGSPTALTVFAAPTASGAPTGIEGLQRVARRDAAGPSANFGLAQPVRTRYVVIWLTSLPAVDGGYRGGIAEIAVRS